MTKVTFQKIMEASVLDGRSASFFPDGIFVTGGINPGCGDGSLIRSGRFEMRPVFLFHSHFKGGATHWSGLSLGVFLHAEWGHPWN